MISHSGPQGVMKNRVPDPGTRSPVSPGAGEGDRPVRVASGRVVVGFLALFTAALVLILLLRFILF
jgi:hypothetical protein